MAMAGLRGSLVLLVLLSTLGSAKENTNKDPVVRNEGREAHRGDLSFIVTGGKPAVLDADSTVYTEFHAALLRDLDAALQADGQTMHERHEFTIWKVERWSKKHSLPLRVKIHLKSKMFGATSGPTLVDILNGQTLKPKSPVMVKLSIFY